MAPSRLSAILPLLCLVLFFQSTLVTGQEKEKKEEESLFSQIPSIFENAEPKSIMDNLSKHFDSTRNFTYAPGQFLGRLRERMHARMERIREHWVEKRLRLGNKTISLIDRITKRFDRKDQEKGATGETLPMFRSFLDALRNTVQGMMDNLKNAADPKRAVQFAQDSASGLKNQLEHEDPSGKAISQLNDALKNLDKTTREKFNAL